MSEQRLPDMAFSRTIARENGKILSKTEPGKRFELFGAYQFSGKCQSDGKNFYPRPGWRVAERREYFKTMYRLRIDGRWYMPNGRKYVFFGLDEVSKMLVN